MRMSMILIVQSRLISIFWLRLSEILRKGNIAVILLGVPLFDLTRR